MPTPPTSTKTSLGQRLTTHARNRWPALTRVEVRFRGQFAYLTGHLPDGEALPLCRLRYGGSASRWGFAIYRASHDDYPGQHPAQRTHRRHPRRSARLRLRALPPRPHRLAARHTDELTGRTTSEADLGFRPPPRRNDDRVPVLAAAVPEPYADDGLLALAAQAEVGAAAETAEEVAEMLARAYANTPPDVLLARGRWRC